MIKNFKPRTSRGQIAVVLSAIIVVLLGTFALCTDVAVLYFDWMQAQKAADSAALAGASYLPLSPVTATITAASEAQINGMKASEVTTNQISGNGLSLTVGITRTVPFYFATLIGFSTTTVHAAATATAETVGSASGITPFGIAYQTSYTAGQTVTLMQGQVGAGNWSALALGGTGASLYQTNIENGYSGTVSVGNYLSTETGVMNGPTQSGINYLLNAGANVDPSGTYASHTLTDPRVVIVPMVDFSGINGSAQVPVKGFAELWLVSVTGSALITTYFISQVAPESLPSANADASNFGSYVPVLTQ
ncbi:MAG TPA: pilus assembly protein TadG-related protein [Candidatus Binataceae bacterium]|nr:pilus assembly protein TadG-related protein [Candidatus Binataceae bacterium]